MQVPQLWKKLQKYNGEIQDPDDPLFKESKPLFGFFDLNKRTV